MPPAKRPCAVCGKALRRGNRSGLCRPCHLARYNPANSARLTEMHATARENARLAQKYREEHPES